MPVQFRYGYKLEISYISENNKEFIIPSPCVSFLYIMHDYDNDIRPYMLIKAKIDAAVYDKLITGQGKGKIYLNIMRFNKEGTSSVYKSYINDQFNFLMTENPSPTTSFDKVVEGQGIAYKYCTIGLYKSELNQINQRQFNGIYKNTNMVSLIQDATSHMKILIEPLKFNTQIETINIPSIDTVAKYISYLNSKYNFYGEQYMYFCDFDKTYLKSNSGKYIDAKDGTYPYIAFDIRNMTDFQVNTSGFIIDDKQKAYIIYSDPSYVKVSPDRITPQLSANIVVLDSNGNQKSASIDTSMITDTESNKNSTKYILSDDPNSSQYIKNTAENNAVTIVVSRTEMDASVFTPNKEYLLTNYEGNKKYTGRYYLAFKQEFFLNNETEFTCSSNIGMRMVIHY